MVFVLFAIVTLACFEGGFRVGRWWQDRCRASRKVPRTCSLSIPPDGVHARGHTGMAADRFDARRGWSSPANAIGAAYLQADYLPDPAAEQMKELLRTYLPLRIAPDDTSEVQANVQRSMALHAEMWAITKECPAPPGSMSCPATVNRHRASTTRIVAGLYARVPRPCSSCCLSPGAAGMVGTTPAFAGGAAS
jgi:hypothetical protein